MTFNACPPEFVNHLMANRANPWPDSWCESVQRLDPSPPFPSGDAPRNVLGEPLEICGCEPLTGWWRDGSCRTDPSDGGLHTVCCVMTEAFLRYSRAQGNDLSTPVPAFGFPGLKPGDHWCVCATRWLQAYQDGLAPRVRLAACEERSLSVIPLEVLRSCAT